MSVVNLTTENFENEAENSESVVLIDFWAAWCQPCKMVAPIIDQIAEEKPDLKVCKVNVDEQQELARRFQIMSIPTLIVMKDGVVFEKSVGALPKESILKLIDEAVGE